MGCNERYVEQFERFPPTQRMVVSASILFLLLRVTWWITLGIEIYRSSMTTPATVTLEQLALPQTGNYRMAIIPIQNSSTHYYTAEVRRWAGYDVKLPGQGVIIHEVIDGFTYVLDVDNNGNTGDEAAIWRPRNLLRSRQPDNCHRQL